MSRVTEPSRELGKKSQNHQKKPRKNAISSPAVSRWLICHGTHITALFDVIESKSAFHRSLKLPQTSQKEQLILN
jgi:hypothetical protein